MNQNSLRNKNIIQREKGLSFNIWCGRFLIGASCWIPIIYIVFTKDPFVFIWIVVLLFCVFFATFVSFSYLLDNPRKGFTAGLVVFLWLIFRYLGITSWAVFVVLACLWGITALVLK